MSTFLAGLAIFMLVIWVVLIVWWFMYTALRKQPNHRFKRDWGHITKYYSVAVAIVCILAVIVANVAPARGSDKTTLKLENIKDSDADTNDSGTFTVRVKSQKNAKVYIYHEDSNGVTLHNKRRIKLDSNGHGKTTVSLKSDKSDGTFMIKAKYGNLKSNNKDFLLNNTSKAHAAWKVAAAKSSDAKLASERKVESKNDAAYSSEQKKFDSESARDSESESSTETSSSTQTSKWSDYKTPEQAFGTTDLWSISNNKLMVTEIKVTAKVIDLGADNNGEYHMLLEDSNGNRYLFIKSGKKTGRVVLDDHVTIYGVINGKEHVNSTQINLGLSEKYEGTRVLMIYDDKVSVN